MYKKEFTCRGFSYISFEDMYGEKCSLQKSSLAFEDAIWLGIEDVKPKVMVSDANKLGISTSKLNGWLDYQLPPEVHISSRMHLTREQVAELLPLLQKFVDTGEL